MAKVTLIDFWAPWCGPCKMMAPVLKEIEEEMKNNKDFEVKEINVDEHQDIASKYGVLGIPTYVVEKIGEKGEATQVGRKVGVTPKAELLKLIIS